jgi:hypothetical protein
MRVYRSRLRQAECRGTRKDIRVCRTCSVERKISRKGKEGRIRETLRWRKLRSHREPHSLGKSIDRGRMRDRGEIDAARAVQRSALMIHLTCASRVSLKRRDDSG